MAQLTTMPQLEPVRISVPPDFPVVWETPEDEQLFWTQDRMHNPAPVLPLESDFWGVVYAGFNRAAESYQMPARLRTRCVNTYLYMAMKPVVPPEQMASQGQHAEERLEAVMGRLAEQWSEWWLPEIQSHLAWWAAFDVRHARMPDLLAHLEETLDRALRLWELHFRIVLPSYVAMSQFDDLYQDLFGGEGAFGSYRLLQGFDNKTLESDRELWALSRRALASEEVRRAFQAPVAAEALTALDATPAGRAFRDALHEYLAQYGLRGNQWGLSYPSWIEDPAPAIGSLQDFMGRVGPDPRSEQAALAAERDGAVAAARARLRGYPGPVIERFEFLLRAAQQGVVLSEDHGFWIDFASTYRVRQVVVEFGRRLAEMGVIARCDDVFYLTLDEVRGLARSPSPGECRGLVATRRAVVEGHRSISPPPALGTEGGPPPDDSLGRFFGKFFGGPPQATDESDVLKGNAGSPGTARGPAKVVRSLAEAGKLQQGDILVAETTAPPWTPLFATAAAIVTDTGGILSHCAVVAREYRIPAVVGAAQATATIRDGQILEVDGDTGRVRICSA